VGVVTFRERVVMVIGVVVPPLCLLAAAVAYWGRGVGWVEVAVLAGMYVVTVLGINVGYHRLFTHRAFKAGPRVRFVLAVAGAMAMEGPVVKWVAIHRRHHQKSDRPGDPHSPHLHGGTVLGILRGFWHAHLGWLFAPEPPELQRSVSDLSADPVVIAVDRFFWLWVALGLLIPAAVGAAAHGTLWGAATGLLWGGPIRLCLMHHATNSVNSICHMFGSQPYESNDASRNNVMFGVVSLGEGWHNNHHAFPTSARHGLEWWQLDVAWLAIRLLERLRLISDVQLPSEAALESKRRGDSEVRGAGDREVERAA
jgi:stearoyl-CoA desaturase (Delta-9 desaturase)